MTEPWHAQPVLVAQAEHDLTLALQRWNSALPADLDAVALVLQSVGRLLALGAERSADEAFAPGKLRTLDIARVTRVLNRDALADALETSALGLRQLLVQAEDGSGDEPSDPEAALAAWLKARDRAEYELLGAARMLGLTVEAVTAHAAPGLMFDQIVEPECFRLVALNRARQAASNQLCPELRARFWWWHAGAGLHSEAVHDMSRVAELVAAFPEARSYFESLVRACGAWTVRAEPSLVSAVRTLRAWLTRRAEVRPADLPLAAAGDDEHLVDETPEYQLSFAPPQRLIVDLIADRRAGAVPSLRLGSGLVLPGAAVPNTEERFAFALSDAILDEANVHLILPFANGELEIVLPRPGDA